MTLYKTNEELKTFSEQRKERASELLSVAVPERVDTTAEVYMENWKTYYNFIKPHMTFEGLTPAQMAGLNVSQERNRWLGLIKASQVRNATEEIKESEVMSL